MTDRITAAEYRQLTAKNSAKKGRQKYGATKIKTNEGTFDSIGEYKRWIFLKSMASAGLIQNLKRQIKYALIGADGQQLESISKNGRSRKLFYICDYEYEITKNNEKVVEDFKGFDTRVSIIKRMLVEKSNGIKIKITNKDILTNL